MSLTDSLNRFGSSVRSLAGAAATSGKLAAKFGSKAAALDHIHEKIHPIVVRRMIPAIKGALATGYAQSGLGEESGQLYNAVVTSARIEPGAAFDGIFISIGSGFSKDVYQRAGAWEY